MIHFNKMNTSSPIGETCAMRICDDGARVMTIYTEDRTPMTYSVTGDRINFIMFRTAILYEKEDDEWKITDIYCDDTDKPLLGMYTLLGTMKMIAHYKIDIAWRWFHRTKYKAEELAENLNVSDIPLSSSPLFSIIKDDYADDIFDYED